MFTAIIQAFRTFMRVNSIPRDCFKTGGNSIDPLNVFSCCFSALVTLIEQIKLTDERTHVHTTRNEMRSKQFHFK